MKTQAIIVVFFAASAFAAPQETVDPLHQDVVDLLRQDTHEYGIESVNILGNAEYFEVLESRTEVCDGAQRRIKCHNETAVSLCTPAGQRIIHCQGLTPRCNPVLNVCVAGRIDSGTKFSCPSQDGYYPDFSSCRKYYFCAKGKAKEYNCDITDVYDPKTRSCIRHIPGNPCHRFQCIGKQGRFTPYPGEHNVYAICSGSQPVQMFRCPEGQGMNEREQNCKTHCEKEGLINDPKSCQKYHECTRTLTGFRVRDGECPPGAWFDPKHNHCRMLENEKDCPEAAIQDDNSTPMAQEPTEASTTTTTTTSTTTPKDEDNDGSEEDSDES